MNKIDLCGEWNISDSCEMVFKGTVPGCIHTDLFTNNDMFYEKNSQNCRFIEEHDWKYTKEFVVDDFSGKPMLYFEGLDTYCEIYLNDTKIGYADNMFIPHKFSIEGILKKGKNLLEVKFFSPIKAVADKPNLGGAFTTERLHTRRMQCTYGWDWVDRFVTCGIFRPTYILFENEMMLQDVYVFTTSIDKYSAQVKIIQHFKNLENGCIVKTELLNPLGEVVWFNDTWCEEQESVLYADIENPQLWYPHNYGAQPIYTLRITVGDEITYQKFGVRTVKILQLKDTDAETIEKCRMLQQTSSGKQYDQNTEYSGFILLVNGVRIFCTGANWVPCEPFPSEETDDKITKLLETSVTAGINMIRVWGGGIFEKEHFYNECDRLGILVTQDFLMACGTYPETETGFKMQLKKEAEFAAIFLRNHPSLIWWSGDNENAVDGYDTMQSYPGRISARSVIAPVLEKLDYNRVFLFSSPYGGKKYASKTLGTTHNTQFLGDLFNYISKNDLCDYREWWNEMTARFIAEEPNMGAVCQESLNEFISPENQQSRDMWLHHTKGNPALDKELMDITTEFSEKLFGEFGDWEDKYFKLRYIQYEWVRISLGNARSNAWFNSGIIYWMLNDCWPATMGWSILDYYTRPKCGFYAVKAFGTNTNLYITKESKGYNVNISNISERDRKVKFKIGIVNLKTNIYNELRKEIIDIPCGVISKKMDITLSNKEILIAEIEDGNSSRRNWYKEGLPLLKKSEDFMWKVNGNILEVWSETYIHVVEIECGKVIEDNYFSLLPREKRIINIESLDNKKDLIVRGFTFN